MTLTTDKRDVARTLRPPLEMPLRRRLAMVAMGYVPFLNVLAIVALAVLPDVFGWPHWTGLAAVAWLLLVPPLIVRLTLLIHPFSRGDIPLHSREFLLWWFTSQWQVI